MWLPFDALLQFKYMQLELCPNNMGQIEMFWGQGFLLNWKLYYTSLNPCLSPSPMGKMHGKGKMGWNHPQNKKQTNKKDTHTHTYSSTFVKGKAQKFKNVSFP
jgi:hypothetical protein